MERKEAKKRADATVRIRTVISTEKAKSEIQSLEVEAKATARSFGNMSRVAATGLNSLSRAGKRLSSVFKNIGKGLENTKKRIGQSMSNFTKTIKSGVKCLRDMRKDSDSSSNAIERFGKRVWSLAKRIFVFSVIMKAFRAVRASFGEGVGYYLAWDKKLASSVNDLKNQVLTLKATFGGAFAPIVEIVVPLLSKLVGWLISATNAVGAFIARLTGKNTYKSVVAMTADSGKEAASSVGDATKAVKELKKELADYDELHVINKDEPDAGTSSGGGSGGGSGASGPSFVYEDVAIGDEIKNLVDKLKEAWKNADFTEIGQILGQKLKDALDKIPWEMIKENARKVGESLATLINGFISVKGLPETIGRTLGEAINTGITLINGFLHEIEFKKVGDFLGNMANSFFSTWDADMQAENFYLFVNGIFDAIYGACDTFEWGEVGTKVGDCVYKALTGILWDEKVYPACDKFGSGLATFLNSLCTPETFSAVGATVAGSLNSALHVLNSFGTTFKWTEFGKSLSTGLISFLTTFDWNLATATFNNLGNGITRGIGAMLDDFNSKDGFKFVGTKIGQFLRRVLLNHDWEMTAHNFYTLVTGIVDAIHAMIAEFANNDGFYKLGVKISEAIQNIEWETLLDLVAETIWDALNAAIDTAKGLFEGTPFEDAFNKIDEYAKKIDFETLKNGLHKILEVGLKFTAGFMSGLVDALGFFVGITSEVLSAIGTAFGAIGEGLKRIDPKLVEHIGYALGVMAVSLGAILLVSKVQVTITGIGIALGLCGPAGEAAAAGVGAAAQSTGLLATAFGKLKTVFEFFTSPGGLFGLGIVGALELGKGLQLLEEETRGENGEMSELGGFMQSIAGKFSPAMEDAIRKDVDELENADATTEEWAETLADTFMNNHVTSDKLKEVFGDVDGAINITSEDQELFNKVLAKMGPESEKSAKKLQLTSDELDTLDGILWDVVNDAGMGTDAKIQLDKVLADNKGAGTAKDMLDALAVSIGEMGMDSDAFIATAKKEFPNAWKTVQDGANKTKTSMKDVGDEAKNAGTEIGNSAKTAKNAGADYKKAGDDVKKAGDAYDDAGKKTKSYDDDTGKLANGIGGKVLLMAVLPSFMKGAGDSAETSGKKINGFKDDVSGLSDTIKKTDLKADGENIGKGFVGGFGGEMEDLPEKTTGWLTQVDNAIQTAEDMHSPSKKWEGFGQNLVQGLINGAQSLESTLITTIQSVVSKADTEIKKLTGDGIKFDVKPTLQKISDDEIQKLKDQLLRQKFEIKVSKLTQDIPKDQKNVKDGVITAKHVEDKVDKRDREIKDGKYVANTVDDKLPAKEREIIKGKYIADQIKDSLPAEKREIKKGKYVATLISDELTAEKRDIKNSRYVARYVEDSVPKDKKYIQDMDAVFKTFTDKIRTRKELKDYDAWVSDFSDKIHMLKRLYDFTAYVEYFKDWLNSKTLYGFTAYVEYYYNEQGGVYSGGAWKNLPQYASGGSPSHGTMFVAGENGAEVVGTINGRTEVLNKSQIAMAMYSAVKSAMSGFGREIVSQIAYDTSVLVGRIDRIPGYIPDVNQIQKANVAVAKVDAIDYGKLAQALSQNGGDANFTFTANLDGREIFRQTVSQNDLYKSQTGRSAFA